MSLSELKMVRAGGSTSCRLYLMYVRCVYSVEVLPQYRALKNDSKKTMEDLSLSFLNLRLCSDVFETHPRFDRIRMKRNQCGRKLQIFAKRCLKENLDISYLSQKSLQSPET